MFYAYTALIKLTGLWELYVKPNNIDDVGSLLRSVNHELENLKQHLFKQAMTTLSSLILKE